ncbi:beta-microseminoprotein-like [Numenius arquata]|uniref:beta-microseminoprotein-like n=1 Tax=Numenius arquata TaxID=31919 RepID=UPI003D304E5A
MLYNSSYSGHTVKSEGFNVKTTLACLLLLAISATPSNAYCFFERFKPGVSDGVILGCLNSQGEVHKFGSWKTEDCHNCSCSRRGIHCCSSFASPAGYDKEKCESIFNKETCTYKVVKKNDHSKECPVKGWVG